MTPVRLMMAALHCCQEFLLEDALRQDFFYARRVFIQCCSNQVTRVLQDYRNNVGLWVGYKHSHNSRFRLMLFFHDKGSWKKQFYHTCAVTGTAKNIQLLIARNRRVHNCSRKSLYKILSKCLCGLDLTF